MKQKKAKRKSSSEHPEALLALSHDAPVHLPMAYGMWLPAVAAEPRGKAKKSKGGRKASKHKGAA